MAHTEKTIASQTLFEGRIIEVRKRDKVGAGKRQAEHPRSWCCTTAASALRRWTSRTHPAGQAVSLPLRQEIIELPAGKIEKGEDPRECGIRELQEECGCTADRFEKLTELYPTPGLLQRDHPSLSGERPA